MNEGLKIRVGADLSDLNKELKTAQRDMQSFGASVSKGINAGGFDDFTQKVRAIKKPVGETTRSLVDMGRIVQDAPYGFLGIANNINPALESFQRLKEQTGSTGKALKSMAAGLLGPAGIGVAFSVVSSALIVLVQKYGSLSGAVTVLTSNFSNLQLAQRDVNIAFGKASADASAQLVTVKALFEIARNTALATETRSQAIKKLNADYGKYLGNLTLETINTDKVNDAQKRLNETLINQAKIKGLQSLISKETEKQANIYAEFVDKIEGGKSTIGGFLNAIKDLNPAFAGSGIKQSQLDVIGLGNEFELSEKKIKLFGQALKSLLTNEAASGNLSTDAAKPSKESVRNAAKEIEKAFKLVAPEIEIPVSFGGKQIFSESVKEMYDAFKNFKTYFERKDDLKIEVPLTIDKSKPIIPPEHIQQAITQMQAMQSELDAMALFVGGPLSDTFAGLFRTIATDGKLSMKQVGEAAKQLVTDLIAAAVKAAVLAVIFKAFGGKAGAVGSFGNLFKDLLLNGKGMATGGIIPPGFENDTFPARLSSREAVIPLDRLESMMGNRREGSGEMVARLRGAGPDLILFLERQRRSQNRSF